MANLKTLRTLGLITTNIHGPLPAWLVNLTLLTVIDIPSSVFSGQIPEFLGSLPLRVLDLSANGFSGVIPRTITNCSNLQFLDLSYLNLGGTIPSDVGLFTKVSHLYIDHNQLVGKMPPSLSNCSSLRILVLGYNPDMDPQPLPQWMGSLVTVEVLFLSNMNLVGNIPSEITRLPRLTSLYLHANQFNGTIPKQLGNCSTLETLLLGLNDFTGGIPSELWELLQLRVLDLEGMNLTGGLSDAVGNLTYLEEIYCHFNLLSGPIPSRLSELPSFVIGNFLDNSFDGQIPTAIGNMSSLQRLDLSVNLISGSIPASMGNLSNLVQLAISETWVTGVIPSALMSCTHLLYLDLGSNQLVGSIPAEIGNLQALQELSLENNQLSGALPSSLGSGSSLVIVDVSYNAFRDVFPGKAFRNASSVLISLNLSHNFFSGALPRSFGRLTAATMLQLSNNKFSGSIPSELGGCLALTALDLSENDFSGTIPQTLASLEHLTFLNLSYNDLEGPLPDTGIFSSDNLSATWFLGNPGLCGSRLSKNCSTSGAGSSCEGLSCRAATLAVTICSVAFALLVVAAGTFVVLRFWRVQKGAKVHDGVVMFAEGLHLTEQDLLNIVEEPDNLIATGASSFVYRAKLSDGKVFAVKILGRSSSDTAGDDFHSKQLNKAKSHMYREAETLSKLKHRNILKVFGMVSSAKMTGLMVEFMPLGSLDNLLHNVQECPLGWEQRLDIAAGIAQGLIYLHEEVEVPIIHMDLKPANILLDADMTPKLGDFGIARFTNVSSSDGEVTATNLCGTFGYIPPEYANNTRVSTRGDVYSYGVVLLELVTRRRPNTQANDQSDALSSSQGSKDLNPLIDWVLQNSNDLQAWSVVVDPLLLEEGKSNGTSDKQMQQVKLLIQVGLLCTQTNPHNRPRIYDVLAMLTHIRTLGEDPVDTPTLAELVEETTEAFPV